MKPNCTHLIGTAIISSLSFFSCSHPKQETKVTETQSHVRLITLDPGHFHAALVQKSMYPQVDSVVHIFAPQGTDVEEHLKRIEGYNTREEKPTHWQEEVYTGPNYLEKMLEAKAGNVVVIAGNNFKKTEYIKKSVDAGLNVLADKPMCIDSSGFSMLKEAFQAAEKNKVLLYDIMTERSEITTILQKELSQLPAIFGELQKGSLEHPAVTKESVHHFFKYVSGNPLKRPAWFMDVAKQGEGLVDVTSHLVDLVQWECFPEQVIDYQKDIQLITARRWPTSMTQSQFQILTQLPAFPNYLKKDVVHDTVLNVFANGEINYTLKGVHAKVSVIWNFKAPKGAGDTHFSVMRGTKVNLTIRQGAAEKYVPELFIEPQATATPTTFERELLEAFSTIKTKYPGIDLKKQGKVWQVVIPQTYRNGHEAHFAEVMERYLQYLKEGKLPSWEVPNMLAKYYTTTKALQLAKSAGSKKAL